MYHNTCTSKFSDRQALANRVDSNQTAPDGSVWSADQGLSKQSRQPVWPGSKLFAIRFAMLHPVTHFGCPNL